MEGDDEFEFCFEKTLSETDVKGCLEIPQSAQNLPVGNEVMLVVVPILFQNGSHVVLQFRAGSRRRGGRYMTDQWRAFVAAESPRRGDKLRYYHFLNSNVYVLDLQRRPDLRLFGEDIYS